jgi:hypothetical protein
MCARMQRRWPGQRKVRILELVAIFVFQLSLLAQENKPNSAAAAFASITAAVDQGRVGRIEVFQVPANIEARAAIKPEDLEKISYTKIVVRDLRAMSYRDELGKVFKSTSVQPRERPADLRIGMVLYSREAVRLGSVYCDRLGHDGAVDDSPVQFQGNFCSWLESKFSGGFQK